MKEELFSFLRPKKDLLPPEPEEVFFLDDELLENMLPLDELAGLRDELLDLVLDLLEEWLFFNFLPPFFLTPKQTYAKVYCKTKHCICSKDGFAFPCSEKHGD